MHEARLERSIFWCRIWVLEKAQLMNVVEAPQSKGIDCPIDEAVLGHTVAKASMRQRRRVENGLVKHIADQTLTAEVLAGRWGVDEKTGKHFYRPSIE